MSVENEIIFIGDSLVEWYEWGERFPGLGICNLGISGETVQWMYDRVPHVIDTHPSVSKVFIMSGINNVAMQEGEFIAPYAEVIEGFKRAYEGVTIYVHSLLPTLLPWIPPEEIQRINRLLKDLADEMGSVYIDVNSSFHTAGVKECLSEDGIHISPKGYEVWAKTIEKFLR
jgi:lysophospholipase L1-like esterase